MFKQVVVKNCPVTRASRGVVRIAPGVLAELAGTLEDEKGLEWAVLLHGSKSDDGLEVEVTSISVPAQERHGTEVDVADESGRAQQPKDCMGVLHSHHSMGAFFSTTDRTKLNPRYGLSIVISSNIKTDEDAWLGFSYQAEGKVILPCGTSGLVPFGLLPLGVEDWPVVHEVELGVDEANKSFGDCSELMVAQQGTKYTQFLKGVCERTVVEERKRVAIFGTGHGVTKLLPAPRKYEPVVPSGGYKGGCTVVDRRQPALLHEQKDLIEESYRTAGACEFCDSTEDVKVVQDDLMCYDCRRWYLEDERALDYGGWRTRKDEYDWKEGSLSD